MASTVEDLDRRVTTVERAQGETTETLRWVVTKLARVQAVQDEHTLRLERLESKMDVMQSKMDAIGSNTDAMGSKMDAMGSRTDAMRSRMDAMPRAIAEMIDASEKRIMAAIARRG